MIALIDMDGVLADLDAYLFSSLPGLPWSADQLRREYRFSSDGFKSSGPRRVVRTAVNSPGFFYDLPLVPGARAGMEDLTEALGVENIWLCTKPLPGSPHCLAEKSRWVDLMFPAFRNRVIYAPDKSLIRGTFLLDDAIDLRQSASSSWVPVHYRYPYNADVPANELRWTWHDGVDVLLEHVERNRR